MQCSDTPVINRVSTKIAALVSVRRYYGLHGVSLRHSRALEDGDERARIGEVRDDGSRSRDSQPLRSLAAPDPDERPAPLEGDSNVPDAVSDERDAGVRSAVSGLSPSLGELEDLDAVVGIVRAREQALTREAAAAS